MGFRFETWRPLSSDILSSFPQCLLFFYFVSVKESVVIYLLLFKKSMAFCINNNVLAVDCLWPPAGNV
jgi:hypothetical protein